MRISFICFLLIVSIGFFACTDGGNASGKDSTASSKSDANSSADRQATRLGDLTLESGYPSEEATNKLYDERDFQRACQVHTWALPMVGFHALHLAQRDQIGVKDGDVSLFFNLEDKKGMLTPNITTLYAFSFWDLSKRGSRSGCSSRPHRWWRT